MEDMVVGIQEITILLCQVNFFPLGFRFASMLLHYYVMRQMGIRQTESIIKKYMRTCHNTYFSMSHLNIHTCIFFFFK